MRKGMKIGLGVAAVGAVALVFYLGESGLASERTAETAALEFSQGSDADGGQTVEYSYEVAGRPYRASQRGGVGWNEGRGMQGEVKVCYDPQDPHQSALVAAGQPCGT